MAETNNNFVVKPFAGNATNNGQFGSFDAGTPQTTNDVIFMQGLDAWLSGWLNATNGATKLPRLEEFQGIQRVFSQALININQYGIKPYLTEETYRLHAFVQDENGKLYQSLEDNNAGNPLTDSTKWNNNPFNTGDFALLNGDENETFKVADATEDNQAVNLGQLKENQSGLGINQIWQEAELTDTGAKFTDGTPKFRQPNVTYTNTTSRTICALVAWNSTGSTDIVGYINGVLVYKTNVRESSGAVLLIVPPASTYLVRNAVSGTNIIAPIWQELR